MNKQNVRSPYEQNFPTPDSRSITVIPLGGTDRVGMNATLVGYAGRWIMIDAGATFPGADRDPADLEQGTSVEQIIPDFRAIRSIFKKLDAIVITHAHEDHIGALTGLYAFGKAWPELTRVPIYAGEYAKGIIRRKLEGIATPRIVSMRQRVVMRLGGLEVAPIRVTHSAPETYMLAVSSPVGTIVFGSDIKLDERPVLGQPTDTRSLINLGRSGVLAFLGDSTNAAREGRASSEADVVAGITDVMRRHKGRVIVSTFASNLARIAGVAEAARLSGRSIGACGRTILANLDIAQSINMLSSKDLGIEDIRYINAREARGGAVVCTGTQAESGAALMRALEDLESGRRPDRGMRLEPGDLVIHSARAIPGNEASIEAMFDGLRSNGVEVLRAGDTSDKIHASGHAHRADLAEFYRMLRPRFAIPVHGDRDLIAAHTDLALGMKGVEAALSPQEGQVLRIDQTGAAIVGRIKVGQLAVLAVDGKFSGDMKVIPWDGAPAIDLQKTINQRDERPRSNRPRIERPKNERQAPRAAPAM